MIHDAEEPIIFQSEFWDNPVDHDRHAEWIVTVEKDLKCVTQQGNINITKEDVSIHLRKMPNWKVLISDGLNGFCL